MRTVAWLPLAIVTSCLGRSNLLKKSANHNSAHILDHCDVIASRSGFGVPTGVPHSKVDLQTEFKVIYSSLIGIKHKPTRIEHLGGTCIKSCRLDYAPQYNPFDPIYSSTEGVAMFTRFPRTRWPWRQFNESYAVRICVKISRICEFRVIMGIMTSLLGGCSPSTLGSRANDYVKTLATLGFRLHHSPCSLGCWTNNTLSARSLSTK